jgi:alpha-mannosidase
MGAKGDALPAEMLPDHIDYDGIGFRLAPAATGKANAVAARGQHIQLPQGTFNRVYILAASADGDRGATFQVGASTSHLTVEAWNGFVGQWDNRVWKVNDDRDWATSANHTQWPAPDMVAREGHPPSPRYPEDYSGLQPAFTKPAGIAWFASHHHTPDGLNEPYQYSYLFAYSLDLPRGAHTLTLPSDPSIRILAISVADAQPQLKLETSSVESQMLPAPANQMEPPQY